MNKKKNYFNCLVIILVFFFCHPLKIQAEKGSGADFGVQPVYPDNQLQGENGYFSLKVEPGQKQTINVKITNYSDQENTVFVKSTRATTSDGGVISYKEFDKEKDSSIIYDFNDIVKVQQEKVIIPANSSQEIAVDLLLPSETIPGKILGGLHFYQEKELSDEEKNKTVINTFSYSIPVVLTESDIKIDNNLELIKVQATQRNYHNYIEAVIHNTEPSIINKMTIDGKIYKKGSDKEVYARKEDSYKMAPNSTMNFGFDLKDTELKAGKYITILSINADGKVYELEKEFEITKQESKKFNDESVYLDKKSNLLLILIFIGLGMIILVLISILILKKKK